MAARLYTTDGYYVGSMSAASTAADIRDAVKEGYDVWVRLYDNKARRVFAMGKPGQRINLP